MTFRNIRKLLGLVAFALACVMVGSAMTLHPTAQAEGTQTVVVTSPFTAAIAEVRGSVVGINNYQIQTVGSYGSDWSDYFGGYFGDFFGFGFGDGYGFGNGNGRNRDGETERREVLTATGSGVVISDEGYVLTNYHVVEDASSLKISVTEEGSNNAEEFAASLVVYDATLDVAILYAPDLGLPAVTLGDSDTLQVGDWAICIGNPLSFTNTSTVGIVSALNRGIESASYDKYGRRGTIVNAMIQVDAAINSGNSGGGMFSVTGELMGIPTLKYTGNYYSGATVEGIGMCIPINSVKPLIEQVLSGEITPTDPETNVSDANGGDDLTGRPRLGISVGDLNASNRYVANGTIPKGAYVSTVETYSPAAIGGMQEGDIVVEVDGQIITSSSELRSLIGEHDAGDTLNIKVFRVPGGLDNAYSEADLEAGEYIDLQITLAVVDQLT